MSKKCLISLIYVSKGGSLGLVVMGGDSCSEGSRFKSQCRIGWTFFTLISCKNYIVVCLKKTKINEKEAGDGPFKKTLRR